MMPQNRFQLGILGGNMVSQITVDDVDESKVNFTIDYFYKLNDIPSSYQEAISSSDSGKWKKAMNEEMLALEENETFELTPIPVGRKVVGGRWVYVRKSGLDGKDKFKARFVAKGYSQTPGIDYTETFSPTARLTSIRTLMQLAAQYDLAMHQMDVRTAYLNAPIDCTLFVEQPEGFVKTGKNGEPLVYKLNKSLYGLKQSGRNWNNVLHTYLINEGFIQSQADNCVYIKSDGKSVVIVIIWVDDIIVASNSVEELVNVKQNLSVRFKMKDEGELSYFLGIEFSRKGDVIKVSQARFIEKLLLKFNMSDCKPRVTPCEMDFNKPNNNNDDDDEFADATLYREIVGSLVYIMTATRPDLCYTVTRLSQHLAKPTKSHLCAAKHVLRYLKGTINKSLTFKKSKTPLRLTGYCDADWGTSEDRRSITGYCFMLSSDGPLVSWKSRKQPTIALSTCEAEYMAIAAATQEAKFLSQLLCIFTNLLEGNFQVVVLHCDNQGAIALANNPVHHQRSKHIDIKYHYIRAEIHKKFIELLYVASNDNVADIFTKPTSGQKIKTFVPFIFGI